jgi:hypothetical protein
MSNPQNARLVDLGGGNIAQMIAHQVQMFWDPTTQSARVVFNAVPYMLMGDRWQRIGIEQDMLEQDLSNLLHLQPVPAGTIDPLTGTDLSKISLAGVIMLHRAAFDFFYNVRAGTPGYPLQSTIEGVMPSFQEEIRASVKTLDDT